MYYIWVVTISKSVYNSEKVEKYFNKSFQHMFKDVDPLALQEYDSSWVL